MASREVEGIIGYLARTNVPFRVTSTTGGVHVASSYHYRQGTGGVGLAVDFAGPVPSEDSPALKAIYDAFKPVRSQLAELLYGIALHHDHVHVAVPLGTFLAPSLFPEVTVPDDPNLPNLFDVKFFVPIVRESDGFCTGYYFVSSKGEVHSFGPGAPYHGRSEVV
jgi:hypothetical protein